MAEGGICRLFFQTKVALYKYFHIRTLIHIWNMPITNLAGSSSLERLDLSRTSYLNETRLPSLLPPGLASGELRLLSRRGGDSISVRSDPKALTYQRLEAELGLDKMDNGIIASLKEDTPFGVRQAAYDRPLPSVDLQSRKDLHRHALEGIRRRPIPPALDLNGKMLQIEDEQLKRRALRADRTSLQVNNEIKAEVDALCEKFYQYINKKKDDDGLVSWRRSDRNGLIDFYSRTEKILFQHPMKEGSPEFNDTHAVLYYLQDVLGVIAHAEHFHDREIEDADHLKLGEAALKIAKAERDAEKNLTLETFKALKAEASSYLTAGRLTDDRAWLAAALVRSTPGTYFERYLENHNSPEPGLSTEEREAIQQALCASEAAPATSKTVKKARHTKKAAASSTATPPGNTPPAEIDFHGDLRQKTMEQYGFFLESPPEGEDPFSSIAGQLSKIRDGRGGPAFEYYVNRCIDRISSSIESFYESKGENVRIKREDGRDHAELDRADKGVIYEHTIAKEGKKTQIYIRALDKRVNPDKDAVVVVAPRLTWEEEVSIRNINYVNGAPPVHFARTFSDLSDIILYPLHDRLFAQASKSISATAGMTKN